MTEIINALSTDTTGVRALKAILQNGYAHADAKVRNTRRAGVLLPLYLQKNELMAIYIRRTRHFLEDGSEAIHSGQIAFPGGKAEAGETLQATALREASEEIALDPEQVELVGKLGTFVTLSSRIESTVFLGWLQEKPDLKKDPREVAAIYHIPLREIWNQHQQNIDLDKYENKIAIHYHWQPPNEKKPICIWGMTSRVTWQLFALLQNLTE